MKKILQLLVCITVAFALALGMSSCNEEPTEHFIKFVVDGKTHAQIMTSGESVIKMPENPTKDGYTFDGWYFDNGEWKKPFTENSFIDTPISSDLSVYAKFIKNNANCEHEDTDENGICDKCDESYSAEGSGSGDSGSGGSGSGDSGSGDSGSGDSGSGDSDPSLKPGGTMLPIQGF